MEHKVVRLHHGHAEVRELLLGIALRHQHGIQHGHRRNLFQLLPPQVDHRREVSHQLPARLHAAVEREGRQIEAKDAAKSGHGNLEKL